MSDYSIRIYDSIADIEAADTHIFNQNSYLSIFLQDKVKQFYLLQNEKVKAKLSLAIYEDTAFNPLMSPFGGIDISSDVHASTISSFLQSCFEELKKSGTDKIRIIEKPDYLPGQYPLEKVYENCGLHQEKIHTHSYLNIENNAYPLDAIEASHNVLDAKELIIDHADDIDLKEIHTFITQNSSGARMYDLESFTAMVLTHPESYHFFLLRNKNSEIAAVLIAILLKDGYMYFFQPIIRENIIKEKHIILSAIGLYQNLDLKIIDTGPQKDASLVKALGSTCGRFVYSGLLS